ncbi:MAG: competence protein ComEC [Parcubacteria bacterium C7867-006]|nr:MAG: competence protein ComEC [Parcubacteria bacterium C7867-006]
MRSAFSHFKTYLRWYILVFLIILSTLIWFAVFHENRQGILTFEVLNIGQGDALWIESPTGVQVLVDGGPNNTLMKEISKVMPWYDRHIDMLVVTNPDKDHFEGFISLLKKYSVDVVLEPGTENNTDTYKTLEKEIDDKKIPKVLARRGQVVDLGGGAYLQILFPDRDVSGLSSNDGSLVMKLVYGETTVMLTGDSTEKIEHYLVSMDGEGLKSTILKAGHHGSRTSSSEEYVSAVNPEWTVISSGIKNDYGHPHKETIETMQKLKILTYDTCNNGRIIFVSDGEKFVLKNKNIKEAVVGCKI